MALSNGTASKASTRRRRRRRPNARRQNGEVALATPPGQPGMPASSGPRRRATILSGSEGHMRVSRDELLFAATTDDKGSLFASIPLNPTVPQKGTTTTFFNWLSGLAKSYEMIVWHKLEVSWRSAVGTTQDGMVAYGIDWQVRDTAYDPGQVQRRPAVTSLTPVKDHPIWQSTDAMPLRAAVKFLQSRKHYIMRSSEIVDTAPGSLLLSVMNGPARKDVGELWVRYDVSLLGPKSSIA